MAEREPITSSRPRIGITPLFSAPTDLPWIIHGSKVCLGSETGQASERVRIKVDASHLNM